MPHTPSEAAGFARLSNAALPRTEQVWAAAHPQFLIPNSSFPIPHCPFPLPGTRSDILWAMDTETLKAFCALHATPGDEGEVFEALLRRWRAQGLDTARLGAYAVTAAPGERKKSDTVLLVAHADSPGFIVSAVHSPTELKVLALGGIEPTAAALTLKTAAGRFPARLHPPEEPEAWTRRQPLRVTLEGPCPSVRKGDRLCWAEDWAEEGGIVSSPFLDNRIACALLADWYDRHAALLPELNVVLAATAMEEVNGFGAAVLARNVRADAVLALDVTYENERQSVAMGQGPVVTLSDASALLSPALRDRLLACGVPLQTEVYNFSGTDARAFPQQGLPTPVVPLLLPTRGNHSPRESIAAADLGAWPAAIAAVARELVRPLSSENPL